MQCDRWKKDGNNHIFKSSLAYQYIPVRIISTKTYNASELIIMQTSCIANCDLNSQIKVFRKATDMLSVNQL